MLPDYFNQSLLFNLLGGLGLLLFGMKLMSEALQKVAGDRLRKTFTTLTANRLIGVFIGIRGHRHCPIVQRYRGNGGQVR
ncbi:MAG: hypothetical protein R2864_12505 [Syntrophotaleaceae bacterium]